MNWNIISSSADCTRKCAGSALAYAFPDITCTAVAELYTTWNSSEIPEHSVTFPILPRKLINRWKPNLKTTFIDFDFGISTAFNQSGWSNVKRGVTIFNIFDCSWINKTVE